MSSSGRNDDVGELGLAEGLFFGFGGGGWDGCGEADLEDRALKRSAFYCQLGAVRVCDPSADGEAEAVACVRFSLAQISLVEAIEDVLAHVFGHADAGVAHGDECVVPRRGRLRRGSRPIRVYSGLRCREGFRGGAVVGAHRLRCRRSRWEDASREGFRWIRRDLQRVDSR